MDINRDLVECGDSSAFVCVCHVGFTRRRATEKERRYRRVREQTRCSNHSIGSAHDGNQRRAYLAARNVWVFSTCGTAKKSRRKKETSNESEYISFG